MKVLKLSWSDIDSLVDDLSQRIIDKHMHPTLIVAIARGGLTISHLLSDRLDSPVASFTISSYKDTVQKDETPVRYGFHADLSHERILLIDDLADTGRTFSQGMLYLQNQHTSRDQITTASLFTKPHSSFTPDVYVRCVTEWVVFPWEKSEMERLPSDITKSLE